VAVAIQVASDPHTLLGGWQSQGWSLLEARVLTPIPGDQDGNPVILTQTDAFEWTDWNLFGWNLAGDAVSKMRDLIRQGGSDLYAYAMFQKTDFDQFGVKITSYRLVLQHSIVQLLAGAVLILAAAFAAVIFYQYVTIGKAPALQDLQNVWGSGVTSVGQAVGDVGGSIANVYIWAAVAAGLVSVAIGQASRASGGGARVTPAKIGPNVSAGVRAGGVSARVG